MRDKNKTANETLSTQAPAAERLKLRKETLRRLSSQDLERAAGGYQTTASHSINCVSVGNGCCQQN